MKRMSVFALLLALVVLAGCARTAGPDVLDPNGAANASPEKETAADDLVPATEAPAVTDEPAPTDEPAATDAPAPKTPKKASATPTPAPADVPAAAAVPQPGELTKDDLVSAMNAALSFYGDWFYDRSAVIDPAYADNKEYPVADKTGEPAVYPVAEGTFATYDELFAAANKHFQWEIVDVFLKEIGAQDVDGALCVAKSDGLGGPGCLCELDIEREKDAYEFSLEYALTDDPHHDEDVKVYYELRDGVWAFSGRPTTLHQFFTVLLYAEDLRVEFDPYD